MTRSSIARTPALLALLALLGLGVGCASPGGGGAYPTGYSVPPEGHALNQIRAGMSDLEVRKVLGNPDEATSYMTGKAWIPFYYGPDTARSDWMYRGKGRVVFSRNRYTGGLKVIRVMYNPDEP